MLLGFDVGSRARAFDRLWRPSYFLLRGQEKVTKEKATPLPRFPGILPGKFACGLRGLSTGHPALTPNWLASMQATLRAFPSPARRCRGDPGRAPRHRGADSVRRGVASARARRHVAFGVFVSPPIALSVAPQRRSRRVRLAEALRLRPSAYAQGERLRWAAPLLLPFAFALAPSRVRARMARCSTRGPCAAVRRGRQGRAAGVARDGNAFSRGQEPARKARPRLTDLPGRKPGKRQAGWPSLWLLSLWPRKEKVTRAPTAIESL